MVVHTPIKHGKTFARRYFYIFMNNSTVPYQWVKKENEAFQVSKRKETPNYAELGTIQPPFYSFLVAKWSFQVLLVSNNLMTWISKIALKDFKNFAQSQKFPFVTTIFLHWSGQLPREKIHHLIASVLIWPRLYAFLLATWRAIVWPLDGFSYSGHLNLVLEYSKNLQSQTHR